MFKGNFRKFDLHKESPEMVKQSPCGRFRVTMRRAPFYHGCLYEAWEKCPHEGSHSVKRVFESMSPSLGDGTTLWGRVDTRIGPLSKLTSPDKDAEQLIEGAFPITSEAVSLQGQLLIVMIPRKILQASPESLN